MSKKNNNRRETARKEAERIAAKQAASDNRTRNILIGVIAVVVLALVGVGYMLVTESQKTVLSDFDGATPASADLQDRKSTRLNSSHVSISYAVFCLKKKKQTKSLK